MKKFIFALFIVFSIATLACAELLVTAAPLGTGNKALLGGLRYDMNSTANSNMYDIGGFFGYGITKDLDIYGKIGYGIGANPASTFAGLPASISLNGNAVALALKYTFLSENAKSMPVSLAGVLGYELTTVTANVTIPNVIGTSAQQATGDIGAGVIVSKMMLPFIPYFGAVYHSVNQKTAAATNSGSRIEAALGTYLPLSKVSAIVGEFSYNSYSMAGASWTINQISLAYCQKI